MAKNNETLTCHSLWFQRREREKWKNMKNSRCSRCFALSVLFYCHAVFDVFRFNCISSKLKPCIVDTICPIVRYNHILLKFQAISHTSMSVKSNRKLNVSTSILYFIQLADVVRAWWLRWLKLNEKKYTFILYHFISFHFLLCFRFFFLVKGGKRLFVHFFLRCDFVIDTDYIGSKPPQNKTARLIWVALRHIIIICFHALNI